VGSTSCRRQYGVNISQWILRLRILKHKRCLHWRTACRPRLPDVYVVLGLEILKAARALPRSKRPLWRRLLQCLSSTDFTRTRTFVFGNFVAPFVRYSLLCYPLSFDTLYASSRLTTLIRPRILFYDNIMTSCFYKVALALK